MITYQVECWDDYYKDCQQLWREHYDEIAVQKDEMPMKPDIYLYKDMEAKGVLHILTVREDGKMIGYHISMVRIHPHYASVLCAFVDAYFLTASKRRGMVGVKMIKQAEISWRNRGVKKAFTATKKAKNVSGIYDYLGWDNTEIVYTKWISD
jgi:hypothetical protein